MNFVLHIRSLLVAALLICASLICIVIPLSWRAAVRDTAALPHGSDSQPATRQVLPTPSDANPPTTTATAQLMSYDSDDSSAIDATNPVHSIEYPDISLEYSSHAQGAAAADQEAHERVSTARDVELAPSASDLERDQILPPSGVIVDEQEDVEQDKTLPVASELPRGWPVPLRLLDQLDELTEIPECSDWAASARNEVDRLTEFSSLDDPDVLLVFHRLEGLAEQAGQMAVTAEEKRTYTKLRQAEYALVRRLTVWKQAHLASSQPDAGRDTRVPDSRTVVQRFEKAFDRLRRLHHYRPWKDFLLFDLGVETYRNLGSSDADRRHIARRILRRLDSRGLTQRQRVYFQAPVYSELRDALRNWATGSVDYAGLVHDLESYETRRDIGLAHRIANNCQLLRWSHDALDHELGNRVDTHYRNANVRLEISGKILNRLLPRQEDFTTYVDDVIVGAAVRGLSHVSQKLHVRLVPDPSRIHVALESHGVVASDTAAYKGSNVFWNDGISVFDANKQFILDRRGVWTTSAEAAADSATFMRGMRSGYEGIPIVNDIARSIALQGHENQAPKAKYEVRRKLERRVRQRMDRDVNVEVEKAQARFQSRALKPLERLHLYPEPVSLQTTDQRVVARYRIAGSPQLAAFTPRPQASSDSWLSVQVHQSVLNNMVERIGFDGATFTLSELNTRLTELFGAASEQKSEELPEDVRVTFADHDAVRIDIDRGRIALALHVKTLTSGGRRRWRTFAVRVHYVPQTSGLDARFVRDPDGVIELASPRLRFRDQLVLRGIFSKVFSTKRSYQILPKKLVEDSRLADLETGQLVLRDGWVGFALTPVQDADVATRKRGPR